MFNPRVIYHISHTDIPGITLIWTVHKSEDFRFIASTILNYNVKGIQLIQPQNMPYLVPLIEDLTALANSGYNVQ